MSLSVTIVTQERTVLERDDVERLIVPTVEGQITVLPKHAALMASLASGEMTMVALGDETSFAIHGGFIHVVDDRVTVLADAAEHVDEINEARAEEARERAEQRITGPHAGAETVDLLRAQLSVQRALLRLRVKRRRARTGAPSVR